MSRFPPTFFLIIIFLLVITAFFPPQPGLYGWARAETWFALSQDIELLVPKMNKHGVPIGPDDSEGADAAAVFDVDMDGRLDVAMIAGDYLFVLLNREGDSGDPYFLSERFLIGNLDDMVRHEPSCFGLNDFNNDGVLDLFLSNRGKGTLITECRPSDVGLYYSSTYSTLIGNGDGTFVYQDLGIDGEGNKKTTTFDDFDGDGNFDAYLSVSPYYGPYWPQSDSPNQLYPGTDLWNEYGSDIIDLVLDNVTSEFWHDAEGRGIVDFKGVVIRDFDRDGKPDIITGAYADIWNMSCFPWLWTTEPESEGFQGDWYRGLFVFRNISTPGDIRFEDVSFSSIENPYGNTDQMHVYSTVPTDIDNDGDLDLLVSGVRNFTAHNSEDFMVNIVRAYRNDSVPGNIIFTNITKEAGFDFMNDNDLLPGFYQGGFTRTLYNHAFTLVPQLHAAAAIDIDNDGDRDWVTVDRQLIDFDPENGQAIPLALWVFLNNGSGEFTLVDPDTHGAMGHAIDMSYGDFNGDGKIDIVTAGGKRGGISFIYPPHNYIYLNHIENHNHYVVVKFDLNGLNRLGIGTKVTVQRSGSNEILGYDEVRTDFSYGSKKNASLHFGLGQNEEVDISYEIPYGQSGKISGLSVDQVYTVKVVNVDIEPNREMNLVNLKSEGWLTVAVLSSEWFDAVDIEPETVVFAGTSSNYWFYEDVDIDGDKDLILYFRIQKLNLEKYSSTAFLSGVTEDGIVVSGKDGVTVYERENPRFLIP